MYNENGYIIHDIYIIYIYDIIRSERILTYSNQNYLVNVKIFLKENLRI